MRLKLEYQVCKTRLRPYNRSFEFIGQYSTESILGVITDKDTGLYKYIHFK